MGLDVAALHSARRYALSGGGSGRTIYKGIVVLEWGDQERLYDLKSTTKSIGVTVLGLAIADGRVRLSDPAAKYHPRFGIPPRSNLKTGWLHLITLEHLATHTAGFEKTGGYGRLLFRPGTRWHYSDGGPNWLAECLTLVYRRDMQELLYERIFTPIGIRRTDLRWRRNAYRPATIDGIPRREFGSGIHANMRALSRIGYLYLHKGRWQGRQLLPPDFVDLVRKPRPWMVGLPEFRADEYGNASDHYGLLWWNNADGTLKNVPRDAFWSWGLYDSIILVIPSLDLVAVRAGRSWPRKSRDHYDVLRPFFEPLVRAVAAVRNQTPSRHGCQHKGLNRLEEAPYPPSKLVRQVHWDPPDSIIRRAHGSDNWPMTWADDDGLYAAYGDGRGFRPFVERKLSLGLSVVEGYPPAITGRNIRSPSFERTGDGPNGPKASGLLMVDGVLYALVRNVGNARLAWSEDHGRTWTWSPWRLTTSFGCPTFLNFGRNYEGARDEYVYIYSPDADTAYERADALVLARVRRNALRDIRAWEYFAGQTPKGPIWTQDIAARKPVFTHSKGCYRPAVTYNSGLRRYFLVMALGAGDTRFKGGLSIYEAPEPWGPWYTVYFAPRWDVGPDETASFPGKWISADGRVMWLAFSGNDALSVRRAVLDVDASDAKRWPNQ